jgi:hypothetical protein
MMQLPSATNDEPGQMPKEGTNATLDDGSGNNNQMVPIFRKFIKRYGIGMCVASIALFGALLNEAIQKWNAPVPWMSKVPCVLQVYQYYCSSPRLAYSRSFLVSIILTFAYMFTPAANSARGRPDEESRALLHSSRHGAAPCCQHLHW